MKIAILTLRVDNNYGGNLQRFAMTSFLEDLGHDVTVLYFRSEWNNDNWSKRLRGVCERMLLKMQGISTAPIIYWRHEDTNWESRRKNTFPFFQKYVKHSPLIWSFDVLKEYVRRENFDAYIVGSDQVFRKRFTERWGLERFFLDFVPSDKKKIFYSASFGITEGEYSNEDINHLFPLYRRFNAVSVREDSALLILKRYGWINPSATLTLDPTLMLSRKIYERIVNDSCTTQSPGNMFCYVLDINSNIKLKIKAIAEEKKLIPFYASLTGENSMSIEQWLRAFMDSEYVITDSYHGLVFSIIFNKPFYLLHNCFRGNARFESLLHLLKIKDGVFNWEEINSIVEREKMKSISFIERALEL